MLKKLWRKQTNNAGADALVLDPNNIPRHVGIIMDGNGRWAQRRGLPRTMGHRAGADVLKKIVMAADDMGVKALTVYGFSTENWKRSKEEVDGLMKLFRNYLKKCIKISQKNNMRVKVIGDITAFDSDIQESIEKLEDFSKDFTDLHFQIALNYGSRDEITRAVNRMLEDQKAGKLETPVSEDTISGYLDTAGLPDPDLMIRTSGELRLSNYLLWQLAYTEFYFTDVAWPDFHKEDLIRAIEKYNGRDRRYGGVKEE